MQHWPLRMNHRRLALAKTITSALILLSHKRKDTRGARARGFRFFRHCTSIFDTPATAHPARLGQRRLLPDPCQLSRGAASWRQTTGRRCRNPGPGDRPPGGPPVHDASRHSNDDDDARRARAVRARVADPAGVRRIRHPADRSARARPALRAGGGQSVATCVEPVHHNMARQVF